MFIINKNVIELTSALAFKIFISGSETIYRVNKLINNNVNKIIV